jgi:hypothetical protein
VRIERVPRVVDYLVGATEADEVRRDDAISRGKERRNHLAVKVAPGGLAVQREQHGRVARPFIERVGAQALPFEVVRRP